MRMTLHLRGDVDIRGGLQDAMDDGARTVVLDLAEVQFMDSTGLGMIAWLHRRLQERGGQVCVASPRPMVLRLLELASMDRLVGIYGTVEAAESALPAAADG